MALICQVHEATRNSWPLGKSWPFAPFQNIEREPKWSGIKWIVSPLLPPSFSFFFLSLRLCVCSETESQYKAKADLQITVLSLSTSLPGFRNKDFLVAKWILYYRKKKSYQVGSRKQSFQLLCGEKGEARRLKSLADDKVADCVWEASGRSSLLERKAKEMTLS